MLRSSPILVGYAELLLLSSYLFGMNLTDEELPARFSEIGFVKHKQYAFGHILMKTAFTCIFWISLRQMLRERASNKAASVLSDIQVSSISATEADEDSEISSKNTSEYILRAAKTAKNFLVKFWIFIVALTLLLCGITGEQVTGFRIVYMTMFLIFIWTFQVSKFSYVSII